MPNRVPICVVMKSPSIAYLTSILNFDLQILKRNETKEKKGLRVSKFEITIQIDLMPTIMDWGNIFFRGLPEYQQRCGRGRMDDKITAALFGCFYEFKVEKKGSKKISKILKSSKNISK